MNKLWIFLTSGRAIFGNGFIHFMRGTGASDRNLILARDFNLSTVFPGTIQKRMPAVDHQDNGAVVAMNNFFGILDASKTMSNTHMASLEEENLIVHPAVLSMDETAVKVALQFDEQSGLIVGGLHAIAKGYLSEDLKQTLDKFPPATAIMEIHLQSLDTAAYVPLLARASTSSITRDDIDAHLKSARELVMSNVGHVSLLAPIVYGNVSSVDSPRIT